MILKQVKIVSTDNLSKKVFIVGGTGMLGASTIDNLVEKGYDVTSISLPIKNATPENQNPQAQYILKDVREITDTEMLSIMMEKNYMIIAIGADERYTPKKPALDFFRRHNVHYTRNLLRLARLAKIKRVVILGSYFTHFNKLWPELELCRTHPYIRSRVEQMEVAFTFNSQVMNVMVLEIPYIFGTMPKRTPLWSIVNEQLNSNEHVYYPEGGTAMATSKEVAEAVEGALLHGDGGKAYPVASVNLSWKDFLSYILKLQGQTHKQMVPYSGFATKREMKKKIRRNKKRGRESGLDPIEYLEFQKKDAFIDPAECMTDLKYNPDDIYKAIELTVNECQAQLDKKERRRKKKSKHKKKAV